MPNARGTGKQSWQNEEDVPGEGSVEEKRLARSRRGATNSPLVSKSTQVMHFKCKVFTFTFHKVSPRCLSILSILAGE